MDIVECADATEFERWLEQHHDTAKEVWLAIAKKGAPVPTVTRDAALDVALCFGWIDSQTRTIDEHRYVQRFSPRRKGSPWSMINVGKVEELEAAGRMRPAGRAEVATAQEDGRWAAAYASQSTATVPDELAAALAADQAAGAAFEALSRSKRYELLLPLLKARTPAGRTKCVERIVGRLGAP
ncbi:YdeI/OmpD-associated family protein [Pseudonocardia sp. TRM90224]|uniref:YdeI/OmpD-associated family protein n=1 Tax=Pseudonocardia sp. TRM90224 TaxID=2812678 RepID=UPI001E609267|nr:YdeI/OmpD-associated family protein [Pseudonocardia sp. TRM90224]